MSAQDEHAASEYGRLRAMHVVTLEMVVKALRLAREAIADSRNQRNA